MDKEKSRQESNHVVKHHKKRPKKIDYNNYDEYDDYYEDDFNSRSKNTKFKKNYM